MTVLGCKKQKKWGLVILSSVFSILLYAQNDIRRAVPFYETDYRFDNSVVGPNLYPAENLEAIPYYGQYEDNFGINHGNTAEYFKVPEKVRAERDLARKESLKKAQLALYRGLSEQRKSLFNNDHAYWLSVIQSEAEFLVELFFIKESKKQMSLLEEKYSTSPKLKEALSYFGLFRLHGIHGQVTEELKAAQAIEFGYHHLETDSYSYKMLVSRFSVNKESLVFSAEQTQYVDSSVRRIGLDLIWDLREEILPAQAPEMNARINDLIAQYAPYDRIYIDVFKQNAMGNGSPEFLVIWRSKDSNKIYRRELIGLGLITTGSRETPTWYPYGPKGAPGNTPDGVWRIFGFSKYYISTSGDDMRGLLELSYGNRRGFSGRGFHLVFFRSPWGTNASHGCFRTYTDKDRQMGLANVIWATVNPMQLDKVKYLDFGNDGEQDGNVTTQSTREIVKYMRDNVWISNFSEYKDGYSFTSADIYSIQIRREYQSFYEHSGINVLNSAKKLLKQSQTIQGPEYSSKGQYWVYDQEIREKTFDINFRR
ncbi:MAG: L,D-transpeptidase [Bdellovibrionota bacterium]